MSAVPFPATLGLADRLTVILDGLRRAAAARMAANRALGPLLMLLWSRLHRAADRFARLEHRVAFGLAHQTHAPRNRPRGLSSRDRLPSGFAWLIRLVPEAAGFGSQLHALLADPAMASLLAAAPQAGRILRPLCRMLAVPPGPSLERPSAQPRPARPPHTYDRRVVPPSTDERQPDAAPAPWWPEIFSPA